MSPGASDDIERTLGRQVRALRLALDIDQASLAERAHVSLTTLKSLESGRGSTLGTLVKVTRVLGRSDWFEEYHRPPDAASAALARDGTKQRRRATRRREPDR